MRNMSQKSETEHTFNILREYMFYEENLCKWSRFMEAKVEKMQKSKVRTTKLRKPIVETFNPRQRDKLFWSFFVMLKGMDEYNMAQSNLFSLKKILSLKLLSCFVKINKK